MGNNIGARLDELYERIDSCRECNLGKTQPSKVRYKPGFNNAKNVMIVSLNPALRDDLKYPHVWGGLDILKSPEELNTMLGHVWITNIVKCRTRGSKDLKAEYVTTCAHWLEEERKFINPCTIIAVGSLTRAWFEKRTPGCSVFHFEHPGSLKRRGAKRDEVDRYFSQMMRNVGNIPNSKRGG